MGLNIRLDFNNRYDTEPFQGKVPYRRFFSELKTGIRIPIGILISQEAHPLMPNVYNLAFGPLDQDNNIDDQAKLNHKNYSKLFSTIIYTGIEFLLKNEDKFLGIDGSNNARAYLYYRCIQNNHQYLQQFFKLHEINYYVRVLRKNSDEDSDHPIDATDIIARSHPILKEKKIKYDRLYNYFVFNLSNVKTTLYGTDPTRTTDFSGAPGSHLKTG